MMRKITICVPVYDSEEHIHETLDSVYGQNYPDLEILVSIDLNVSDPKITERLTQICTQYKGKMMDKIPTKIFVHDIHLGWVKNCNFLIRQTSGKYFSIIPDDDVIPLDYISCLFKGFDEGNYEGNDNNSDVVNCFPCIKCFGLYTNHISQSDIKGSMIERIHNVINNYIDGVSFRGLIKKDIPDCLLYLNENQPNDFAADSIWIMQHALAGSLRAMNHVVYKKRYHHKSVHSKWKNFTLEDKINLWAVHCATLLNYANQWIINENDRKMIHSVVINRLLVRTSVRGFSDFTISDNESNLIDIFDKNLVIKHAIVLGAGIQGCLIALMLRKHNYSVSLIDQCPDIMMRASFNQEGKIHMGFIYSLDNTMETGRKLMCDALYFSKQIEYLLGTKIKWDDLKSTPFNYIVPKDSHLNCDELEEHFNRLQDIHDEMMKNDPSLSYLGKRLGTIFRRISNELPDDKVNKTINKHMFQGCFETEEVAIVQSDLIPLIKKALIKNGVNMLFNLRVDKVNKIDKKFIINNIQCDPNYSTAAEKFGSAQLCPSGDYVFNCLWEGQNVIDKQMGITTDPDINYRIKFGIVSDRIKELDNIPSYSIVQGPYGDFVNYQNKNLYFSWYPNSMHCMIIDKSIPCEWENICQGEIPDEIRKNLHDTHLIKFQEIFDQNFQFNNYKIKAGIIVANGLTDISNRHTLLHARSKPPITHDDGYYTITTGKFTSAPYNTFLLEMIIKN